MNPSTVTSLYSVFLKAEGYSNISLLNISIAIIKDKKNTKNKIAVEIKVPLYNL